MYKVNNAGQVDSQRPGEQGGASGSGPQARGAEEILVRSGAARAVAAAPEPLQALAWQEKTRI